ncbi:hypothetical protein [Leptothoe sp. PORK10 BA2]|uniref:hypothetical protein n=1 Tax=Leptothoe sp. PORK10 BA2 TaxID=3110254 RepID=UPI002B2074C8|nr:hypothetical protein [Leptothoe sp. PORK10 BA2]
MDGANPIHPSRITKTIKIALSHQVITLRSLPIAVILFCQIKLKMGRGLEHYPGSAMARKIKLDITIAKLLAWSNLLKCFLFLFPLKIIRYSLREDLVAMDTL